VNANSNLRLDTVKFLKESIDGLQVVIDTAYQPKNNLESLITAHAALQSIRGRVRVIRNFLNALEPENEAGEPPRSPA